MITWEDLSSFKAKNPVVTIGIFDGVHRGHHYLLENLKQTALQSNGETVVVSLWPHPRQVLGNNSQSLRYLLSIEEKKVLLAEAGIDHFVIIPFTLEFSQLESCQFVEEYLVKRIGMRHLLVGFNHKFGKGREGDFKSLSSCAERFGFVISQLEPREIGGKRISSSLIRELLSEGKLEDANEYLGYTYFLQGKVVGGNRLGRSIGFPTANIEPYDFHKLIPKDGVYAVEMEIDGIRHRGMLNVGYRPTVTTGEPEKTVEVHLIGFEEDIYGKNVTILFHFRMRDEKKFEGIEQLKAQLVYDRVKAIELLNDLS